MNLIYRICAIVLCCVSWPTFCSAQEAMAPKPRFVEFERDIAPLLQSECASCHKGDGAKNGFLITDKSAVMGLIEPGKSESSSLWSDYLIQPPRSVDKDSLVMPPKGPLKPAQLALIKLWIDEGAEWPEGATIGSASNSAALPTADAPLANRIYASIGYFHPAVVHFPIALFLVAGGAVLLSYVTGPRIQSFALTCFLLAAASSIVTVAMGWSFADAKGYMAWNLTLPANATHEQQTFFFHRWLGTSVVVLGFVIALFGWASARSHWTRWSHLWRIGALLMAGLVGLVGHQGGELVYGELLDKAAEAFQGKS